MYIWSETFLSVIHIPRTYYTVPVLNFYKYLFPLPVLSFHVRSLCPAGCVITSATDMKEWMIFHINLARV